MLTTKTNHLYELQPSDFVIQNNIRKLILPPHLQYSIILNNQLIMPNSIIVTDENKIISLPNNNNIYYLAIHIPKTGMTGDSSVNSLQLLNELLKTKITLDSITPRNQPKNQIIDIEKLNDDSFILIKITNKTAYSKDTPLQTYIDPQTNNTIAYLPLNNKNLQHIIIKLKPDTPSKWDNMILSPLIAVNLVFYDYDNNNNIFQIISPIVQTAENIYNPELGYEYGMFNVLQQNGYVYRNYPNEYAEDMEYTIKYFLTQQQINIINTRQSNNQITCFKCRYAIEKNNNSFIWRDFIKPEHPIEIKINTPPPPPTELNMSERT